MNPTLQASSTPIPSSAGVTRILNTSDETLPPIATELPLKSSHEIVATYRTFAR